MTWLPLPDLGQGLNLDQTPEELAAGLSSDGLNMRYRAGYAERVGGLQSVFTTPVVTPYHVGHYQVGSTRYVIHNGLQKTYVDDGTTQSDITNVNRTGAVDDRWCGFPFNGIWVQNNGVDVPQYWGGTGTLSNLTAWPAGYKAGFMRPFGNIIIAGDITRGGVRERGTILWSHTADPGTIPTSWDITDATKDAGDQPLAETNGTLIDGMALGDSFVIYKDDAIHFAQRIQSSQIFRFGRMPGDTGMIARGCVAQFPGGHVYLAPNFDVLTHSGQGPQSILEGRFKKWLASNISSSVANRSFLVHHQPTNEVLICFPKGSSATCNYALVWNYKDNTFGTKELPDVTYGSVGQVTLSGSYTWSGLSGTWPTLTVPTWSAFGGISGAPRLIFSATTPKLLMFESTEQNNGASYTARMDLKGLHFDDPTQVKFCRGVRPKIDAAAGTTVYVQVGGAMTPDSDPSWSDPVPFTVGTDIEANTSATGRFLAMRLYTTADTAWRIRSAQMDIVAAGKY